MVPHASETGEEANGITLNFSKKFEDQGIQIGRFFREGRF
jgi:hypothetical protein